VQTSQFPRPIYCREHCNVLGENFQPHHNEGTWTGEPHSTATHISDPILNIIKSYSLPKPLLTEASAFDGERPYVMATWGRYMKPVLDALPSRCASLIEAPSVPHAAAALMFMVGWAIMHPNDDHDNIDHRAAFHAAFSRSGIRGNVTFVPLLALLADNRQYDM